MKADQRTGGLRILLLTPKPPFPLTDGGRIAVYEPLRRLVARGHQVTLLTFRSPAQDEEVFAHLRSLCHVEFVLHDMSTRPMGMIRNLFSTLPYNISKYRSPLMARKLRDMMAGEPFDLVHLEQVHMACYSTIAKGQFGVPTVLRQENIESHLAERYWRTQTGLRRVYAQVQAARLGRYEAEMCAAMDRCLVITAEDADRLRALSPCAQTLVVPAGVDLEAFCPSPHLAERDTVVFVGSMDWIPNADAVLWFFKEVLPGIRREFPALQFYVVGRNPPPAIRQLAESGAIHVTGYVDDVRAYFAKASVFVVPLRVGGGMRVKLLQAMAMAKPIVATSIGAEGIAIEDGQNVLLADTAPDFARCVVRLLRDGEWRERLGQNARRLVDEHYSWEAAVDMLERAYWDVIGARQGTIQAVRTKTVGHEMTS